MSIVTSTLEILISSFSASSAAAAELLELPNSGGVKALDLRLGTGPAPVDGDQVILSIFFFSQFVRLRSAFLQRR